MWKESYRLGVEAIDKQHMELFRMVEHLLSVIGSGIGDNKKECIDAIVYLKNYAIQHFTDEEQYQQSINYSGLDEHRKTHQRFTQDILAHEQNMLSSNFDMKCIKDFIGTLIAWLVYHVAGADQQIVSGREASGLKKHHTTVDSFFYFSMCDILNKITGISTKNMKVLKHVPGDMHSSISVKINFYGDVSGEVEYRYTQKFAFDFIRNIASFYPVGIDELVCSAMQETSNLISVKAVGLMSHRGFSCKTLPPIVNVYPAFMPSPESIILDTSLGLLEMDITIR